MEEKKQTPAKAETKKTTKEVKPKTTTTKKTSTAKTTKTASTTKPKTTTKAASATKAKTATKGIPGVRSIKVEDIYDIIGEENVTKDANNGQMYNYYFNGTTVYSKNKATASDEYPARKWH